MKKSTLGLACVCMYLLAASCQFPQSVTLKGSPGVHLPLGSPFDLMETRLEDYINSDKIKEMMGGGDDSIKTYEYTGGDVTPNVEAYIILYPITEMELDLQDYIDRRTQDEDTDFTYNVPDSIANHPGPFPPNGYHLTRDEPIPVQNPPQDVDPLFTLDLTDMAKLVKEVTGGPFGLELNYQKDFEDHLQIKIPALGITNYIPGEVAGDKLRFVNSNTSYTLNPHDDFENGNEIYIYVITTGPCSGTIEPKMVFDWEEAHIKTDEAINNTHTINNMDLESFFGEGVKFREAKGYVYADGVGDAAVISLKATDNTVSITNESLTGKPQPQFSDRFNGEIPKHSLNLNEPNFIDMTNMLNESIADAIELEYDLIVTERHIKKNEIDKTEKIYANLVILLPMEFTTSSQPDNTQYAQGYAKLGLKGLFPNMGTEDLFQRKGTDDDLFNALKTVTFVLSNYQNDVFLDDELYISVSAKGKSDLLYLQKPNPIEFDIGNLPPPFVPKFEFLLKKDASGSAPFSLMRKVPGGHATFDFSLAIQAKTDINQTVTF